jgi:hypothetical protein
MCPWPIFIFPRSIYLFFCRKYVDIRPRNSQKRNTYMGFSLHCTWPHLDIHSDPTFDVFGRNKSKTTIYIRLPMCVCTGVCPGAAGPRDQPACAVPLQPAPRHRLLQVEGRRQARTLRINICHIRTATRSLSYELSLLYTLLFIYIIYLFIYLSLL